MKKIIYSAAIIALLMAFVSCKSTKADSKKGVTEEPVVTEEAGASETEGSEEAAETEDADAEQADTKSKSKSKAKKAEKTEKASSKAASTKTSAAAPEESEDVSFIGWIKPSRKSISEKFGILQLKIKSKIGAYSISVMNDRDKAVPVLSTANEFATNAFYLKTSKRVYNLVTDSNVTSSAKKNKTGAVIIYSIPEVAQITADFTTFASVKDADTDMVKITLTVKNESGRNEEFALKAVLDTILGESDLHHFYTWENVAIRNEVLYRTLQNQKWFVSKNSNAAMQLFFSGAECTEPELVAFANYSTFEKNSWEPDMLSYRAFDTVLSYNNSAVCAIWKTMKLAPSATGKVVFYIAVAADGKSPTGEKFVYSKEYTEKPAEEKKETAASEDKPLEVITPFTDPTVEPSAAAETLTSEPSVISEDPQIIPNVDFYIKNMTKDHLTPEYIQSLLDRIAALEEDSPSVNRQELLQLNAELDAILTYLRQ